MEETAAPPRSGSVILGGTLVLLGLYLTSLHSYLFFHTLIELFTIVVMAGVFVIAWNARAYLANNYLLFVGVTSAFVAVLDLLHAVAYRGMGVFGDTSGNLATQLWVAGRYLQAVTLVIAPFLLSRRLPLRTTFAALGAAVALLVLAIFYWRVFPAAYLPGLGLTAFKKLSEYAVCALLLVAALLLYQRRSELDADVWRLLVAYLGLSVASELAFTEYASVYGAMNLVGHLLRLLAYWALYRAIIVTGLVKPYAVLLRSLKLSEQRLAQYAGTLETRNDELRRSEQRLRRDAAVLASRNEELDAFARTVAHDLKNPMAMIVSASALLRTAQDLPAEKLQDLLRRIQSTAVGTARIVDELLLLSHVRKIEAPRGPVDMAAIVSTVLDRLSEMIAEHAAVIAQPGSWPPALGYAPWLEEVWSNYLTNALKYGGRPPRVELGAAVLPDGQVRFWVRDNGAGVPPGARDRLFVPFTRLDTRGTGHGLGLSIVYQIVDKLGGTVGVESEPGRGSTFFFTLPAASAESPALVPQPA